MGELKSMIVTILDPNTPNIETQAISVFGLIDEVREPDQDTTVYYLRDPAGVDDSILRITLYAGPDSDDRE